jgi:hypothetical protein
MIRFGRLSIPSGPLVVIMDAERMDPPATP